MVAGDGEAGRRRRCGGGCEGACCTLVSACSVREFTVCLDTQVLAAAKAADVAESSAEVALTKMFTDALEPLFGCGDEGAAQWSGWLHRHRHQYFRVVEQELEQLDGLVPSLDQLKQSTTTALHLRGGLEALNLLGGGGKPLRSSHTCDV
jgi:hypothetical protein